MQAIRASMSVPGAVAPAEVGNRQLVDGGLVRNLPSILRGRWAPNHHRSQSRDAAAEARSDHVGAVRVAADDQYPDRAERQPLAGGDNGADI